MKTTTQHSSSTAVIHFCKVGLMPCLLLHATYPNGWVVDQKTFKDISNQLDIVTVKHPLARYQIQFMAAHTANWLNILNMYVIGGFNGSVLYIISERDNNRLELAY